MPSSHVFGIFLSCFSIFLSCHSIFISCIGTFLSVKCHFPLMSRVVHQHKLGSHHTKFHTFIQTFSIQKYK
jgi:hypothetical protein